MNDETTDGLRVVFAGTPDFAVPALEAIDESRHRVVQVVTNPDRPRGRSGEPQPPAVKVAARERDLEVYQPEDPGAEEAIEHLRALEPDVLVVAAYGHILPERLLELPTRGSINIHASLLPKYRGAAPINWAIVEGEDETGVSIMEMVPELDAGPVFEAESTEIGPLETAEQLHDRLADLGSTLVVSVLDQIERGDAEPTPQNDDEATYAPKLSSSDGAIDWSNPAERVANEIRGFCPWPGAYSFHERDGERTRVKFHLARPVEGDGAPGEVLEASASNRRLAIACGEGAIEVLKIQPAGRRVMEIGDFLNGYDIDPGDPFVRDEE